MNSKLLAFMGALVIGAVTGLAADSLPPASGKTGVTFEKDIKALLEASCIKCHGAEKQKGKVRLDSLAEALKSGGGKTIVPGKSADSPLVISVARMAKEADHNMPPEGKGEPFTKEQVGLIRAWIDQGAK